MSEGFDAGTARGNEGMDSDRRLGRILYRIAIFVLFCVAFYSTFEGLTAVTGRWLVAAILTGLFQGALLGTALVLGRDLADYASGSRSARISAGGRGVRYGLTGLIYLGCLLLCVFFAFTFWHRILLDRGTGLDITLPKITQLASKYVAGDLTVAVEESRQRGLAEWAKGVRRANAAASTDAIAKDRASKSFEAEKKAAEDRDKLRQQANEAIKAAETDLRAQRTRIDTLAGAKTRDGADLEKAVERIKALNTALAAELGDASAGSNGTLSENGDAFQLTGNPSCRPKRATGPGACVTALQAALHEGEAKGNKLRDKVAPADRALEEARLLLAAAEKKKADGEKRLAGNPPLAAPASPEATSGKAQLEATERRVAAFTDKPTAEAFRAVTQDCTTSLEALHQAKDPSADGIDCRPGAVEDYVARYEAFSTACGGGEPARKAETIETRTRDDLRRATDQSSRQLQQTVDKALRDTLADVVSPCIDKARAFGGTVAAKAGKIEDDARASVAASVLDRDPQDRAFDAIKSLLDGSGGLPVYGAAFLAVLQETLILCFSFLLHLADKDRGTAARPSAARPAPYGSGRRTNLDWTPDPDQDPPRVLAAKFLHAALDIEPDGSGGLASDFAADAPQRVTVNAGALVKELARAGQIAKMRGGRIRITPEGIALVEAIVLDHHDATSSADARLEPQPGTSAFIPDPGLVATPAPSAAAGERVSAITRGAVSPAIGSRSEWAAELAPARGEAGAPTRPEMAVQSNIQSDLASQADPAPQPAPRRKGRPRDFGYSFHKRSE
jgi:hypothetical protein